MRLTISDNKTINHKDLATCVSWLNGEEVYTCSDDHKLMKWNVEIEEGSLVADFGETFYPTEMQWIPKQNDNTGGNRRGNSETLAIGTSEGKVWLIGRNGRVEKSIDSHVGAVLCIKWSWDGVALLTAGEDGVVKLWSRGGMLRSSLSQNPVPVYSGAWSPNSDQVLYSCGKQLVIKSIQANVKPILWKAHESIILTVDWSPNSGLIVSGAEDCKYRVWTGFGTLLYTSGAHDYPITSVAWAPDGTMFAMGSFDTLRLCDKNGWSHSMEKPRGSGSVLGLSWSADSTQLAGVCGSGRVLLAHVSGLRLECDSTISGEHFAAELISERRVAVTSTNADYKERLEFRDRVVKMTFKFDHLVVATISGCYVYSERNWNTPVIIDLKQARVTLILQCEKSFLLVDGGTLVVYSYEGRLLCTPKLPPSIQPELLNSCTCSLSVDTLAILDRVASQVHIIDITTPGGRLVNQGTPLSHSVGIMEIALEQVIATTNAMGTDHRKLVLLDANRDLHLYSTKKNPLGKKSGTGNQGSCGVKLAGMVSSFCWHEKSPSLCAVQGQRVVVWPLPSIGLYDRAQISKAVVEVGASLIQSSGSASDFDLMGFFGSSITMRRKDGSIVSCLVPPYIEALHRLLSANKISESIALCRLIDQECLWTCLGAISLSNKDIDTAKTAYAAIHDIDRVEYLEQIRQLPRKEARQAELQLLVGHVNEAETTLMSAGLVGRAILTHLHLFNWERALELASGNGGSQELLELVLGYRHRFLESMDRRETNKMFLNYEDKTLPEWNELRPMVEKLEKCENITA